jgi:hypothetical protein
MGFFTEGSEGKNAEKLFTEDNEVNKGSFRAR